MRIIGIDPGLQRTGWGVLDVAGVRLSYVAHGVLASNARDSFETRLLTISQGLEQLLCQWQPHVAAVEEIYVNVNPRSTLKLGMARGACLLAPARFGIPVAHLTPTNVKKSIVGSGRASKDQVAAMVKLLLGRADLSGTDATDALGVAIAHAHYSQTLERMEISA